MNNNSGSIYDRMTLEVRQLFHQSISQSLCDMKLPTDRDWSVVVKDDDLGLVYQLYYFSKPSDA